MSDVSINHIPRCVCVCRQKLLQNTSREFICKHSGGSRWSRCIHLAKLLYFTNLGFPEIRGFPLLFTTICGEVVWGRYNLTRFMYFCVICDCLNSILTPWSVPSSPIMLKKSCPTHIFQKITQTTLSWVWHHKSQLSLVSLPEPTSFNCQPTARKL